MKVLWAKPDTVEFAMDELTHAIGVEPFGDDGVRHPALDVLVDTEIEGGEQGGATADEDEVVVFGEVLEEEA